MKPGEKTYPPYVRTLGFGSQSTQIPGDILGARTCMFALEVEDIARLQATCDHFLSEPSGGRVQYEVLGDTLFVSFMHARRLTSAAQAIGWVPDSEAAFWVPLIGKGPGRTNERLVFWMPYIVISVPEGMVTGREVWGFRKQVGTIDVPGLDTHPTVFQARANVYDPLGRETEGRIEPLITIRGPGAPGGVRELWGDLKSAAHAVADLWTGGTGSLLLHHSGLLWNILEHLLKGEVELVNLKQFRDAGDSTRACYQAVIEGPCKIHKIYSGGLLPDGFEATIPNWESHRIPEHLGLPLDGPIPVRYGTWVHMDFSADAGREVWKAGT